MLVGFHATYTASAMFLTGMASNPLIADFARKIAHVELTWTQWALSASVPGTAVAHRRPVPDLSLESSRDQGHARGTASRGHGTRSHGPAECARALASGDPAGRDDGLGYFAMARFA